MLSDEIRKKLKQWDTWRNKISNTPAILDREYADVDYEQFVKYADLTRSAMAAALHANKENIPYTFQADVFDCDDYALLFQALFELTWMFGAKPDKPAPVFRCVAETDRGPHAFNIAFTKDGILFCEPQTGRIWNITEEKQKILAIT